MKDSNKYSPPPNSEEGEIDETSEIEPKSNNSGFLFFFEFIIECILEPILWIFELIGNWD